MGGGGGGVGWRLPWSGHPRVDHTPMSLPHPWHAVPLPFDIPAVPDMDWAGCRTQVVLPRCAGCLVQLLDALLLRLGQPQIHDGVPKLVHQDTLLVVAPAGGGARTAGGWEGGGGGAGQGCRPGSDSCREVERRPGRRGGRGSGRAKEGCWLHAVTTTTHMSPHMSRFSSAHVVMGTRSVAPSPRAVPSKSRPSLCFRKWWSGMSVVTWVGGWWAPMWHTLQLHMHSPSPWHERIHALLITPPP
jgi:hypothetical protein